MNSNRPYNDHTVVFLVVVSYVFWVLELKPIIWTLVKILAGRDVAL